LSAAEGVLAEAKERARVERERIRQQVASKKAKIVQLKADREAAIKRVPEESLRQYEQCRVRHPGDAIVDVRNGSCGGCHFSLLPNRLVEVHQGEKLVRCDHCGRLLSEDKTREEVPA
jgi:predicted  nucleic acid-binding Zn-ribbon protein